ncbi:YkgJ family cysteine cluster protein [Candidatus Micrarchaeota archaeon]|nr:YkgJ family cysteine cluster protein [Candidatus Micrarchaeota archaeon]
MSPPEALSGPCAECNARCCRNYTITITARDLLRLIDYTESFGWIGTASAKGFDPALAHSFTLFENNKPGKFVLCLKRDRKETCVFLGKGNRCAVYAARPMVCRTYPFRKDEGSRLVYKKNYRCPVQWKITSTLRREFLKNLERQKKELAEYGRWCGEWNASVTEGRDLASFIDFMISKAKAGSS